MENPSSERTLMKESGTFRFSSLRISERGRQIPEVGISDSSSSITASGIFPLAETFVE